MDNIAVGGSFGIIPRFLAGTVADYCNCDRGFGIWRRNWQEGEIVGQIQGLVGKMARMSLKQRLKMPTNQIPGGIMIIRILSPLVCYIWDICQASRCTNTVWEVQPKPERSFELTLFVAAFLSFSVVLGVDFYCSVSLVWRCFSCDGQFLVTCYLHQVSIFFTAGGKIFAFWRCTLRRCLG